LLITGIGQGRREKSGRKMIALVFEACGAFCCFALAVFLAWAAVAKLRPDLDEQEFDLAELKKPVSLEPLGDALSIEPPIVEEPPPGRRAKKSKRSMRERSGLFHTGNFRTISS
jgi:hypothetical protein